MRLFSRTTVTILALAGVGLGAAALAPTGGTQAGWNSTTTRSQAALTMGTLAGVGFTDSGQVLRPQGAPAVQPNGYGLAPTSFYVSASPNPAGTERTELERFVMNVSGGTFLQWGQGEDCGHATLTTPLARSATGVTTTYDDGYWAGTTTSPSGGTPLDSPVPAGVQPTRCMRFLQSGVTDWQRVMNNAGSIFRVSTSYRVTQPGQGTWYSEGPDLSALMAHPAKGVPNTWTASYGVPLPPAQVPSSAADGSSNTVARNLGVLRHDLSLYWAWPTSSDSTVKSTMNDSGQYSASSPALDGRGGWELFVRPKPGTGNPATEKRWLYVIGSNIRGNVRSDRTLSSDIGDWGGTEGFYRGYKTAPGWYEIAIRNYAFTTQGRLSAPHLRSTYSVSTFVINLYMTDDTYFRPADAPEIPVAARTQPATSPNTSTATDEVYYKGEGGAMVTEVGGMTPGAHGFLTEDGIDVNAQMATVPTS